ncbi:MAG: glycosyltransferase family protein [Spirochaetes bacterium]|nr:glycosyltransferase family protein [Spirochaetota bacterium]
MTEYKVIAVIQARMSSTRLPGKTLKEIGGKTILEHVINRTAAIKGVDKVIVATAETRDNLPIIDLCSRLGIESYAGSPENVLHRYYSAAQPYTPEYVMRVTADNPFTDVEFGTMAVSEALSSGADLSSVGGIPLGTAVEMIKFSALADAFRMATDAYHFEHVTPYLKENPDKYDIRRFESGLENPFPSLRLTVDTEEDYNFAQKIHEGLFQRNELYNSRDIIEFIKKNPVLMDINSFIKQRPMTHSGHDD